MPNWCSNAVVVYGDKDEVKLFKERYAQAYVNSHKNNTWGTYELFAIHNYDKEFILSDRSGWIRGPIYDSNELEEDGTFRFFFESAWSPMIDGIRRILSERYKTLRCEVVAEECGEAIYVNTDVAGRFFQDRYVIYSDETGSEYFENDSQLIKFLKETFNYDVVYTEEFWDDQTIEYAPGKEFDFHRFVAY